MATRAGHVWAVYGKQFVVKIGSKHRMVLEWVDQAFFKESKEEEEIKKSVQKIESHEIQRKIGESRNEKLT